MAAMDPNNWTTHTPNEQSTGNQNDISPSPGEFLWASYTLRYGIDSGETIPPEDQSHVVVWATDHWIYYVQGRDADQRDRLVAVAAAAREGPAVVKPLE